MSPMSPEDIKALQGCMNLAKEGGRKAYYESVGNDLSEIQTFTNSMIGEINEILATGEKIDKLKVE